MSRTDRIKVTVTFDKCDPISFTCYEGEQLLLTMKEADAIYINMIDGKHGFVIDTKYVYTTFDMKVRGVPGRKPSKQ